MNNIFPLAPKMTLQYAERAKRGEYDNYVGSDIYEFFVGNQVICLIGLNHPTGHINKVTTAEMQRLRETARRKMD